LKSDTIQLRPNTNSVSKISNKITPADHSLIKSEKNTGTPPSNTTTAASDEIREESSKPEEMLNLSAMNFKDKIMIHVIDDSKN
jgi:hypothetical protein